MVRDLTKSCLAVLVAGVVGWWPAQAQIIYRSGTSNDQSYRTVYRRDSQVVTSGGGVASTSPQPAPQPGSAAPGSSGSSATATPPSSFGLVFPGFNLPQSGNAQASPAGVAPSQAPFLRDGLFFKARLVSGVLAPIGMTTPVLAEADSSWCGNASCAKLYLIGTAVLSSTGRAMVRFDRATSGSEGGAISAVAFDRNDLFYGLRGEVMDIAPSLAADLVRAAFGGLSDWVKALTEATTVTVTNNGAVSSRQAGPIWAYALGRIGQSVTVPNDAQALIRAVVIGAGSEIMVMTGYAEQSGK